MDESRRRFLKGAGATALGLGCGMPILDAAQSVLAADQGHDASPTRQWAMVVDIAKCRDERVRRTCITACHREHAVPTIPQPEDEVKWIWAEQFENTFPDEVHAGISEEVLETPVLVLCNHCSSPPCVRVCPTGATWKRDSDGIVMMDMHRCIGCRYCMAACPYGSRSFNWRDPRPFIEMGEDGQPLSDFPTRTKGVVEKCNFCAERLREDREPACVEAVNSIEGGQGALIFGDLSDASSEVRQVLRERYTIARRVGLGTGPNVFYIV